VPECRFIGNVHTPWPSWAIVAQPSVDPKIASEFLKRLNVEVQDFNSSESRAAGGKDIAFIRKSLGYDEEDIRNCEFCIDWALKSRGRARNPDMCYARTGLETVDYPADIGEIKQSVVLVTLSVLEKSGVVQAPSGGWQLEDFVDGRVAKIV
jgi:hypothetical protein